MTSMGEIQPRLTTTSAKRRPSRCDAACCTWVVLNTWLGKAGETKCPKCGSPVRFHNWDQEAAAGASREQTDKDKPAKPKPRGRRGAGGG